MIINDYLYGEYNVDKWLMHLVHSPALQRLRWIALSNIPSVSYPMISGVSRYAHSLGVCILADKTAKAIGLDKSNTKELMVSALLHDAGMPPLGHLTEEALGDIGKSFDHEESLNILLFNEGRRFAQMPDGENVGVIEALINAKVDSRHIFDTIKGKNDLGNLIASKIDLDNIDNIIRIYKLIFNQDNIGYNPQALASNYFAGTDLDKSEAYATWADTRMHLYNMLMFSIPDFGQKATIKRIIKNYFEHEMIKRDINEIIDDIRFMNDYQFLNLILETIKGSEAHVAFNSGRYDRVVEYGWINTVEKNRILEIKMLFTEEHSNYYIDIIPDKRFKYTKVAGQSKNGALVGLFSYNKKHKKTDVEKTKILQKLLPEWEIGILPELTKNNISQLNLI